MKRWFSRQHSAGTPPPEERGVLRAHSAVHGASAFLWVGDLGPIGETPIDWMETSIWRDWEPPLNAIRGEFYSQEALKRLAGAAPILPVAVDLTREPRNPHDANAIRADVRGELVGHVARELAAVFAPILDGARCSSLRVPGILRAGPNAIGVHIWPWRRLSPGPDLSIPSDLAEPLVVAWPPEEAVEEDEELDPFDRLERQIADAWSTRDLPRLVDLTRAAFDGLDAFVERTVAESRVSQQALEDAASLPGVPEDLRQMLTDATTEEFPVHHIAAISTGGPVLAAIGDLATLEALAGTVRSNERLEPFAEEVERLLFLERLTSEIIEYVREHPGAIQKDVYAILSRDKAAVSTACFMAATVGRLHREKHGVSYSLTIA